MSGAKSIQQFYVGWDVGAWHCDGNRKSRDAIVILNDARDIVGEPWRGNLRKWINAADTTKAWIHELFERCRAEPADSSAHIYLAIDTPLGFSEAFVALVTERQAVKALDAFATNPYLFRATERFIFEKGELTKPPLSAVQDMIGSQATKGMHVLAKFARNIESCGVWTDGKSLTVLEAYPATCRKSKVLRERRPKKPRLVHQDRKDALTCALIASLYAKQRHLLAAPGPDIPTQEGWIWVPKDALKQGKRVAARIRPK